jgi:hypothetical protein
MADELDPTLNQPDPTLTQLDPTLNQLMLRVLTDPSIKGVGDKQKLIDELRKSSPPKNDRWIYRYTILFLGTVAVFSVVAVFILSTNKYPIPDAIVAIGSAAVGALAGLLAPSAPSSSE